MTELLKKYRLIWDITTKEILTDWTIEYESSTTEFENANYDWFESNSIDEIKNKIEEEKLTERLT